MSQCNYDCKQPALRNALVRYCISALHHSHPDIIPLNILISICHEFVQEFTKINRSVIWRNFITRAKPSMNSHALKKGNPNPAPSHHVDLQIQHTMGSKSHPSIQTNLQYIEPLGPSHLLR